MQRRFRACAVCWVNPMVEWPNKDESRNEVDFQAVPRPVGT
ncbi:unnamed protein product [Amoebophrya sp. A120]|nr:unnamed protein product [Amoebophrya sp. A120]|eukprot:GSA120T00007042001.1